MDFGGREGYKTFVLSVELQGRLFMNDLRGKWLSNDQTSTPSLHIRGRAQASK